MMIHSGARCGIAEWSTDTVPRATLELVARSGYRYGESVMAAVCSLYWEGLTQTGA